MLIASRFGTQLGAGINYALNCQDKPTRLVVGQPSGRIPIAVVQQYAQAFAALHHPLCSRDRPVPLEFRWFLSS